MDSLTLMSRESDTTIYGVKTGTCTRCEQVVAIVSISQQTLKVLDVWSHHTIILHKKDAEDFGNAITDAITVAELEKEFD